MAANAISPTFKWEYEGGLPTFKWEWEGDVS